MHSQSIKDDDYGGTANDSQLGIVKTRKIKVTSSNVTESDNKQQQLSPGSKYNNRPSEVASGLNYGSQSNEGQ